VSGMSVVLPGREGPYGVMEAHTKHRRNFSEDDAHFLQTVANVLATAVQRKEAEEKLHEVREAERSRIARDLHDEALQDLAETLVEAQLAQSISKDPELDRRLGRLVAALDRIGPHLRSVIYDLRLEEEQDKPFSELLESLVELHRGMAPDCDICLDVHDGILSGSLGETGREVLRIVGEALTNTRRHSGAHNARVDVWVSEGKLQAEVSDDGQGVDPESKESAADAATGGMGIKGMRERARALGGELKVQSEPGEGTKVRFELALEKNQEKAEGEEVRLLLVEDHDSVREALASTFEQEAGFEVVGQAGSLAQARRLLEKAQPVDVAVVDLGLPDGYGGDLIKELREANPRTQALVLSASLDQAQIARAVEAGAAKAMHKTAHLDEVVEAVRGLRAGQTLMPLEEVVELLRFAASEREEEYEARQAIEKLTPREIEVLQALAEGLDSEGIAERLKISIRTERNHMANILAKLEVHSQLQALVFAQRHGVVETP
jgi:DNA-binding NarL/FixJ family response regulator